MKFLFDQSADFRLIPHLSNLGHDVKAISRDYPHSLPDEDVLEISRKEQRLLIVADRDFGELIFHRGLVHAGVIFFRLPGASLQTKIPLYHRAGQHGEPALLPAFKPADRGVLRARPWQAL
jgi:Domain of unknown function (DUF5615)